MKVLYTVDCPATPLRRGTGGPHPAVIVLNEIVRHVCGGHMKQARHTIEDKCCRPYRDDEPEALDVAPESILPGRDARRRNQWDFNPSQLPLKCPWLGWPNGHQRRGRQARRRDRVKPVVSPEDGAEREE